MTELRELWIDGFGCLRTPDQPFRFERGRINLFLDDNEAGKTTLQMALVASLYGIETNLHLVRTSPLPHKAHWLPRSGPPFGTRLHLHDGRRLLEIRWNFAEGNTVHAIDLGTNQDVTEELCPTGDGRDLGWRLLGLKFEEFLKTSLVRHEELIRICDAKGIDSLVQRAAGSKAGDTTVALARDRLNEKLRDYPGVMLKGGGLVDNEIRRLEEEIERLHRERDQLEAGRAAIADEDAEFQRAVAERELLRREAARLDYLAQIAEHDELVERVKKARECRATLDRLEAERQKLASLERFPAEQADAVTAWQAERLGLLRQIEQAENAISRLREHGLGSARRDLEAMGRIASVAQDDVGAATELLGRTRDFEAREQRLLDTIRREEEELAAREASVEDLDRLEERFTTLEPGDGEFLTDQERAVAQIASEIEEAKRRSLEATLQADRTMAARQREREAAHRSFVTGLGVGAAGLVLGVLLILLGKLAVGIVLMGLGLAPGAFLVMRAHATSIAAESLQGDELAQARLQLSQLEARRDQLAADQRDRAARLKTLARHFGYEQPDVLIEDYRSLDDLRRLCGTLIHLRGQAVEMDRERQEVQREVAGRFLAYGAEPPPGLALSRALEEFQERMAKALRLRQQIQELAARLAAKEEEREKLRQRVDALASQIGQVLAHAGLRDAESIEHGIEAFTQRLEGYQRLRQLCDVAIPQARAMAIEPAKIDALQADAERLHRTITTQREQRPELLAAEAGKRAAEYRQQLADAQAKLEELKAKAEEVGRRVVDTLHRYHAAKPALEEQLLDRKAHLTRARRDKAALELAIRTLDDIGLEVHGRWAEQLNRSTCQLLERIAPTLADLKFDSKLQFRLRHRHIEKPIGDEEGTTDSNRGTPVLSTGTWDQLYLAVRLGLADFVAQRGSGGLLLLDDPFAHFDDTRFEKAIHVLSELALGRHQVILFSCQRQRFEWLRSRNPKWFETHIARRRVATEKKPSR